MKLEDLEVIGLQIRRGNRDYFPYFPINPIALRKAKIVYNFGLSKCWLVGCFGFNGPLRQYFSLYWAVSQREGGRGEKG